MIKNKFMLVVIVASTMVITACGSSASPYPQETENVVIEEELQPASEDREVEEIPVKEIDLAVIKPNEAGQIMVLMYHHIAEPEAEWVRTPDNFRKDLQTLYEKGYRPISLKDYVTGNITTEAGFTPVVLTFDDGRQNNFDLIQNDKEEWVIDPNSAVAILEKFNDEHPDFPLEATFFVNNNIPFGQEEHLEYKLKYITDRGMDIGNHTATHVDFTKVDAERIQKELSSIVELIDKYLPGYSVDTLALPFGSRPKDKELYRYLEKGSFEGLDYKNIAILNVGWDPYKSPYHLDFDPLTIHRIRASELEKYVQGVGMYDWINNFEKGSRVRFISDGDENVVTVPINYEDVLDPLKIGEKKIRLYTPQE